MVRSGRARQEQNFATHIGTIASTTRASVSGLSLPFPLSFSSPPSLFFLCRSPSKLLARALLFIRRPLSLSFSISLFIYSPPSFSSLSAVPPVLPHLRTFPSTSPSADRFLSSSFSLAPSLSFSLFQVTRPIRLFRPPSIIRSVSFVFSPLLSDGVFHFFSMRLVEQLH